MKHVVWLLAAFVLSCVHTEVTKPPVVAKPYYYDIYIQADPAFTPYEREILDRACSSLRVQTSGRLRVSIEFTTAPRLAPYRRLIRLSDSDLLTSVLDNYFESPVVGAYVKEDIFLVPERIWTDAGLEHTMLHEVGHSIGLADNYQDNDSIMFWRVNAVTTLSKADHKALCRIIEC